MEATPVYGLKHVQMLAPVTSNGGATSDIICLKNCNKAYIVVEFTMPQGHATTITPLQCTDVSNSLSDNKALTNNVRAWKCADTATNDTLTAMAAAKNFAATAQAKNQSLVIEIVPEALDVANNFDCVYVTVADSSQATDLVSVTAWLDYKYRQATPPTAITD